MITYDYHCQKCSKCFDFSWDENSIKEYWFVRTKFADCPECGEKSERFIAPLYRKYTPPLWHNRMTEIHKAQEAKGEKLRFVHPSEIGAS